MVSLGDKDSFPLDKMAAILQTIFSVAFSWMKSFVFWLKFHWSLFLRVQLTKNSTGLDIGLAPNRRQAITLTNADPIHWCIYAAQAGDELTEYMTPLAVNDTTNLATKTALYLPRRMHACQ